MPWALFTARTPEVPGPIPKGLGGDAPLQVEWGPCDLDPGSPHRRTHTDIGRALRQINRAENFPRTGTVPSGGIWDSGSTPNTITIEDDEFPGVLIVVNLPVIPGKDPNLRDGDQVDYFYKGDTAKSFYEYHDDEVRTLKFWTGEYEDIPAGWARADGEDNKIAGIGGTGFNYVGSIFIGGHLTTAGEPVAAVASGGAPAHNHDGSSTNINVDPLTTVSADAVIADHDTHTHAQPDHDTHTHDVSVNDHVEHHHHLTGSASASGSGGLPSDVNTTGVILSIGDSPGALVHETALSTGSSVALSHETNIESVTLVHSSSGHVHSIDGHVHTSLNIIADGAHAHSPGAPAYMTAIPIERIP